jgi:hypothetical protein
LRSRCRSGPPGFKLPVSRCLGRVRSRTQLRRPFTSVILRAPSRSLPPFPPLSLPSFASSSLPPVPVLLHCASRASASSVAMLPCLCCHAISARPEGLCGAPSPLTIIMDAAATASDVAGESLTLSESPKQAEVGKASEPRPFRHSVLPSDIKASELPASQGPTASPGPFASKVPPYELDGSSRSGVH